MEGSGRRQLCLPCEPLVETQDRELSCLSFISIQSNMGTAPTVSGPIPGANDTARNKTGKAPACLELTL